MTAWETWWASLTPDERAAQRTKTRLIHDRFREQRRALLWGVLEGKGMEKEYIGDGIYASYDDRGNIDLTTEDGIRVTNRIVVDTASLHNLLIFIAKIAAPEVRAQIVRVFER